MLYDISNFNFDFEEADEAVEAESSVDVLNAKAQQLFEVLQGDFVSRAPGLVKSIRNLESETEALEAEIARLRARKAGLDRKVEVRRNILKFGLLQTGLKKIDCQIATVSIKATPSTLKVDDSRAWEWPEAIFNKCCEQTVRVKKTALKELPEAEALALPGVEKVEGGQTIQIR